MKIEQSPSELIFTTLCEALSKTFNESPEIGTVLYERNTDRLEMWDPKSGRTVSIRFGQIGHDRLVGEYITSTESIPAIICVYLDLPYTTIALDVLRWFTVTNGHVLTAPANGYIPEYTVVRVDGVTKLRG